MSRALRVITIDYETENLSFPRSSVENWDFQNGNDVLPVWRDFRSKNEFFKSEVAPSPMTSLPIKKEIFKRETKFSLIEGLTVKNRYFQTESRYLLVTNGRVIRSAWSTVQRPVVTSRAGQTPLRELVSSTRLFSHPCGSPWVLGGSKPRLSCFEPTAVTVREVLIAKWQSTELYSHYPRTSTEHAAVQRVLLLDMALKMSARH